MIKQNSPATAGKPFNPNQRKEGSMPIKNWHETNPPPKKPSFAKASEGQRVWHGDNSLKIIPLGGCEEVGKNMTV